jgi:cysteine desulfurase family protein (TIGR01976 family)
MAYDVARVRGLHPSLGDGWVHFDAQNGMLLPDSVSRAVSTAFRGSMPTPTGPHPSAQRSAAVLTAARQAVADLVNADPEGVVLGPDRAVLLTSLADASSGRVGLGYEMVVTRLDDEANIAPWLRAANRYGAKVKWGEVDIETGELPNWQWEGLITAPTRLVAITSASSTLGTVTDLRAVTKLVHDNNGLAVVDHSAAAPYRLIDIDEIDADVVAVNAIAWGGPPIGALVFRDPSIIDSFSSVSLNPYARGPARLEVGSHQFGLLAGVVASIEYLASLDESAHGTRR